MKGKSKPTRKVPAYKDTQLVDRPSERWKDIPGLEGYFQISSYGRIKRNQREVIYPNGAIIKLPDKIILPKVAKSFNKHVRDYVFQLHAHLRLEGRKYHLAIRRLVYYCFVKPFPLDDLSVCIVSSKGNGLDISPDNLEMLLRLDNTKRIYARKRMVSIFRQEHFRRKGLIASLAVTGRQVSQYDEKGKRITTFPSISDAARAFGINASRISHVVNELEPTAAGYFWKYGKDKTFDVKAFLAGRRQGYREKRGTRVTQYDKKGNPVGHYICLQDAGKAVDGHWTAISAVIRGVRKSAYGYRWKRGHLNRKLKALS
ncbi:MAG TPA: NUMOD4 domain-containing protein [Puia sp.]|jgi:hypothetical protein|nr:NUMOD4 domain-containing protein [Puia sp.]